MTDFSQAEFGELPPELENMDPDFFASLGVPEAGEDSSQLPAGELVIETHCLLNPSLPLSQSELRPFVEAVRFALGMPEAEVQLSIVNDAEMAQHHEQFKSRIGPTNVLSFPDSDPERPQYIGEIILSADTLVREADLYGQPVLEHFARLLAHAFLHLAGYPHGEEMYSLTEQAVQAATGEGSVR